MDMLRRFTDQASSAIHLATEEARLLRHGHVGTEHVLFGLAYEGEGLAAEVLEALGSSPEEVASKVVGITRSRQSGPVSRISFTPQAKKALEASLTEALALGRSHIGTAHILLGLLRDEHSTAARILADLGVGYQQARERIVELLHQSTEENTPQQSVPAREQKRAPRQQQVDILQAVTTQNERLRRELERLRGLLREHGIEPDGGTAQTA